MMRLYVLVEGPTEELFVRHVLAPHLQSYGVLTTPVVVETSRDRHGKKRKGGGDWMKWRRDLLKLTGQQHGSNVRFTTLFDLYGLPGNFPGNEEHRGVVDTRRRVELLEVAMAAEINDWRLIPYLQRHEFEALVLAGLDVLEEMLDVVERPGVRTLRALVAAVPPEDVNDGQETAPSKRLEAAIPSYGKTVHGPLVVEGTGLAALRARCPRFNQWVSDLEALAQVASTSAQP